MAEGAGMTRSTSAAQKKKDKKAAHYDDWEVRDAMHTMMRAGEIVKDKALMGHVRKHAAEHARKSADVAQRAAHLAKSGKISEKQMAKLKKRGADGGSHDLEKMTPIA